MSYCVACDAQVGTPALQVAEKVLVCEVVYQGTSLLVP